MNRQYIPLLSLLLRSCTPAALLHADGSGGMNICFSQVLLRVRQSALALALALALKLEWATLQFMMISIMWRVTSVKLLVAY